MLPYRRSHQQCLVVNFERFETAHPTLKVRAPQPLYYGISILCEKIFEMYETIVLVLISAGRVRTITLSW